MTDADSTQFKIEAVTVLFVVVMYGLNAASWEDSVVVLLASIAFILSSLAYNVKRGAP